MNNITEDRKHWHNLEAELGNEQRPNICQECKKGVLITTYRYAGDETGCIGKCDNCGHEESL